MTGYHISIGYLSGADKDEAWIALKRVVLELCHNIARIADEAACFGMSTKVANEYALAYQDATEEQHGTKDSTLRIIERKGENDPPQVMQLAGGSGESRDIKEEMRRAFCRLVMHDMHQLGLEININVA